MDIQVLQQLVGCKLRNKCKVKCLTRHKKDHHVVVFLTVGIVFHANDSI